MSPSICMRCDRPQLVAAEPWNTVLRFHSSDPSDYTVVGYLCQDCQTAVEHLASEIDTAAAIEQWDALE